MGQTPKPHAERPSYAVGEKWLEEFAVDPPAQLRWPLEVGHVGLAGGTFAGAILYVWKVEAHEEIVVAGDRLKVFRGATCPA